MRLLHPPGVKLRINNPRRTISVRHTRLIKFVVVNVFLYFTLAIDSAPHMGALV